MLVYSKGTRSMVRKNRGQLRNAAHLMSDSRLAEQIGEALRYELGASRRAAKTVMRWTGVSDTTARSWLNGRTSPSGSHLLELAAHSEPVMIFFLEATGHGDLEIGLRLQEIEHDLEEALDRVRSIRLQVH